MFPYIFLNKILKDESFQYFFQFCCSLNVLHKVFILIGRMRMVFSKSDHFLSRSPSLYHRQVVCLFKRMKKITILKKLLFYYFRIIIKYSHVAIEVLRASEKNTYMNNIHIFLLLI